MVDLPTLRRVALSLPEACDTSTQSALRFEVAGKGFAWTWMELAAPKKPRRPRLDVLAVRCPLERKAMLLDAAPDRFFDEDHYRGYPALLVRLEAIEADELAALLADACALIAPRRLAPRQRNH